MGAVLKIVGGGRLPGNPDLPEGIEVLGERDIDETYQLIAGARALILPALWAEPFGRVFIEALRSVRQ
jgi:glycosyltransferase involved in cell wall biosynthesis